MRRGTVVEDAAGKLWLCVQEGNHPVSPDQSALMHCEDQRIDRPVRWLKNVTAVRVFSEPVEP